MKKVNGLLAVIILVGLFCGASYLDTHYTRKDCEVVKVENGIATFEDSTGHHWDWEIEENEYFEIGDFVDLKMHTNNSNAYIYDDEILEIVFHD